MNKRFLTMFVLAVPGAAFAQTNLPVTASPKAIQHITARETATDLFKTGNPQAAIAQLKVATLKGSRAASDDVQIISQVCLIARGLAAANHANARATALAAVNEAARARNQLTRAEKAYVDAQIGQLYETTLGDSAQALQYYQSALAQDSNRKDAEAGAKRIARLQALVQMKEQENAKLRAGGK